MASSAIKLFDFSPLSGANPQQTAPHRQLTTLPNWDTWLARRFSPYLTQPFAPRHLRLWKWIEALTPGVRPLPRVEPWPRSGGKSTTVELGCARVAAKLSRRFVLYVSATQPQADKHVQSIGFMLERLGIPRAVNEYGYSRGWRHRELRTGTGFNCLALGLEVAVRGIKLDMFRPDLVILDDFDAREDSEAVREKKVNAITTAILPAGTGDCAVLVIQNLVTRDSIMSRLVSGKADFLVDRECMEPEPAVRGLETERVLTEDGARFRITAGTPTWAGQSLADCENDINTWGLGAFLREAQHEVDELEGGLWSEEDIDLVRVTDHPALVRVCVGVDPSGSTDGDEAGIIAAGMTPNRHAYVLEDASLQGSPQTWAGEAVTVYKKLRASRLVAEANQGGEMVAVTIGTIPGAPRVALIHASQGKAARAEPVHKLYQDGRIHHVGYFPELEREMRTWKAGRPSPNRMDALVHVLTDLLLGPNPKGLHQPATIRSRAAGVAWARSGRPFGGR